MFKRELTDARSAMLMMTQIMQQTISSHSSTVSNHYFLPLPLPATPPPSSPLPLLLHWSPGVVWWLCYSSCVRGLKAPQKRIKTCSRNIGRRSSSVESCTTRWLSFVATSEFSAVCVQLSVRMEMDQLQRWVWCGCGALAFFVCSGDSEV